MTESKDWEQTGFDAYPTRDNYPDAGTYMESQWLAGWYRAQRVQGLNQNMPELEDDTLAGRNTFAVGYTKDDS